MFSAVSLDSVNLRLLGFFHSSLWPWITTVGFVVGRFFFFQNGSIKSSELKGQRRHGKIPSISLANTSHKENRLSQPVIRLLLMYKLLGDLQKEGPCFIPSHQAPWKVGCSTDSEPLLQQIYVIYLSCFPMPKTVGVTVQNTGLSPWTRKGVCIRYLNF